MKHQSWRNLFALTAGLFGSLALATFTFIGCSSSGGGGGTSVTDSTGTDDVTTDTLKSLSNIPDFDIDSLDVASQTGSALQFEGALRAIERGLIENSSTDFSRAGCEYRTMMDEVKFNVKVVQTNICIMKEMEANTEVTVPDAGCNYYQISIPMVFDDDQEVTIDENAVEGAAERTLVMNVRLCFVDDQTLTLAMCNTESGTMEQRMWFDVTAADGKFDGTLIHTFPAPEAASKTESFKTAINLPKRESIADYQEGDEGTISSQFSGIWGSGSMGLTTTVENDVAVNVVTGSFHSKCDDDLFDCGDFTGRVYTKANPEGGCTQFASSGSFPSWDRCSVLGSEGCQEVIDAGIVTATDDPICLKPCEGETPAITDCVEAADSDGNCAFDESGTECFTFQKSGSTLQSFTYDVDQEDADATLVAYHTTVRDQDLSEHVAPTIAFTTAQTWDCSAADSFTEIDLTDPSMITALSALESCFGNLAEIDDARERDPCHAQEGEADLEKEGEEVDRVEPTYGGGSDVLEALGATSCTTDADCSDGMKCHPSTNLCTLPCRNDNDCSAGVLAQTETTLTCDSFGFCMGGGAGGGFGAGPLSCDPNDRDAAATCASKMGLPSQQSSVAACHPDTSVCTVICQSGQVPTGTGETCNEFLQGTDFTCSVARDGHEYCIPS